MVRHTQVEVVLHAIAQTRDTKDEVPDSCSLSVFCHDSCEYDCNIRAAEAFLPKYLAWYLPKMPVPLMGGADPLGNCS